ncbi:alpha/beta hydrolase fold domain-containing protein [Nakamurella sp. YIM 132087]|uniref:Alpha/beta hydrolase fold domain-containing protein n=1 Tax=Nakamurella alba TaxID=2665158 RepID=A0A7K1FID9_9ACTN|nr:alpha/beta hydrolase fold domain-containing protein [Nakamurella alba]MTD13033.1 alpha/beta hydrolase fold domain-containing protein [Nakamurella alba]
MARSDALDRAEDVYRNGFPDAENATVEILREQYDAMLLQFPLPEGTTVTGIDAGGVPALEVRAAGAVSGKVLVWFHGGGYVLGSARGFTGLAAAFSAALGFPVILPDYRLAPENKFPAAALDGAAVLRWAVATYGPGATVVGGDSGGGGLTFAALAMLVAGGEPVPAAAMAISPLVDFTAESGTIDSNAAFDVAVSRGSIGNLRAAYLQGDDPRDPVASPLFGALGGLPPVHVVVGSTEVLLDDARSLVDGITTAGGTADLTVYDDMCHVWPLFASFLPEGQAAVEQLAGFAHKYL